MSECSGCRRSGTRLTLLGLGFLLFSLESFAVAPPYISDEELATRPVVIVGHWDGARFASRNQVEGDQLKNLEGHTEFVVERVICGDVQPGRHPLLLSAFLGWFTNGGPVMSFTSTEMVGDITDVRHSSLWFLAWRRSWDESDPTNYLVLDTYRGVQPLELETYFQALRRPNRNEAVPRLLTNVEPIILERTLEFLNGGRRPWPYWTSFDEWHRGKKAETRTLTENAQDVAPLLTSTNVPIRRLATAVYASLAGRASIPLMRAALHDADAEVREIATGALAAGKDAESLSTMRSATGAITNGSVACAVIARLAQWGNERVVPVLMQYLENDVFGGSEGTLTAIPALQAQNALKRLTGFVFPYDVKSSQSAWDEAKLMHEPSKRTEFLLGRLGDWSQPLVAHLMTERQTNFVIRVTNVSAKPVMITRPPAEIEIRDSYSLWNWWYRDDPQTALIRLKPGDTSDFTLPHSDDWRGPSGATIKLLYARLESGDGFKPWIGWLQVKK